MSPHLSRSVDAGASGMHSASRRPQVTNRRCRCRRCHMRNRLTAPLQSDRHRGTAGPLLRVRSLGWRTASDPAGGHGAGRQLQPRHSRRRHALHLGPGRREQEREDPATFEDEVKQALENIRVVLDAGGMAPSDIVSVQVYLTDGALFQRFNTVYRGFFKDPASDAHHRGGRQARRGRSHRNYDDGEEVIERTYSTMIRPLCSRTCHLCEPLRRPSGRR